MNTSKKTTAPASDSGYPKTLFLEVTPTTGRKVVVMNDQEQASIGDGDWKEQASIGVSYEEHAVARQLAPEGETPKQAPRGNAGLLREENNTERGRLEWQARDIGMKVDRRWSNETLRSYIYQWQTGGEYERDKITAEVQKVTPTPETQDLIDTLNLNIDDVEGTGVDGEVTQADVLKHAGKASASDVPKNVAS